MDIIGSYIGSNKEAQDSAFLKPSQIITDALLTVGSSNYITELTTGNYIKIL